MSLKIFDLGRVPFKRAWDFQKQVFLAVKRGDLRFAMVLCRHDPVITMGRAGRKNNILIEADVLRSRNIDFFEVERGGDVTYHGPGQLTIYPIFDLHYLKKDINSFLRNLEGIVIELLGDFGIRGMRLKGLTGVWVSESGEMRKIASIGISIRNWITFHGLTLNVKADDLKNFALIRPCGMDIKMTALESLVGREIAVEDIKQRVAEKFKEELDDQSRFAGVG